MKRTVLAIAACVIAAACSSSTPAGPGPVAAGSTSAADAKPDGVPHNWVAHLTGDDEVPSNASKGQGQVKFQLSADGTVLSWRLIASNIENPFMAHIHLGAPGVNGGIVLWLHGTPPANSNPQGTGRQNGVLASGSSTAAGLVGALAGQPMSALIAALDSGNTYVNVHTSDGVSPTNTGVGDLFNGEIRGQIRTAGHGN